MAFRPDVLQYRELFDWIRTERHQPREEDIYENLKNSSFAEVANHGILLLGKETCYLEKKGLASEAHKSVCRLTKSLQPIDRASLALLRKTAPTAIGASSSEESYSWVTRAPRIGRQRVNNAKVTEGLVHRSGATIARPCGMVVVSCVLSKC